MIGYRKKGLFQLNDPSGPLPLNLQVNESDKTFSIPVPWNEISQLNRDAIREWLASVKKLRAEWEAKGYKFK